MDRPRSDHVIYSLARRNTLASDLRRRSSLLNQVFLRRHNDVPSGRGGALSGSTRRDGSRGRRGRTPSQLHSSDPMHDAAASDPRRLIEDYCSCRPAWLRSRLRNEDLSWAPWGFRWGTLPRGGRGLVRMSSSFQPAATLHRVDRFNELHNQFSGAWVRDGMMGRRCPLAWFLAGFRSDGVDEEFVITRLENEDSESLFSE